MIARKLTDDVALGDGGLFFGFDCALQYTSGYLLRNVLFIQT
jgi:hypothetical protein